ncbi:hypothetical protein HAX54_040738, partial [Datura stramonium]|nr:hypothetical protein [Datura stramonium]
GVGCNHVEGGKLSGLRKVGDHGRSRMVFFLLEIAIAMWGPQSRRRAPQLRLMCTIKEDDIFD